MHGEINVSEIMERQERLNVWRARQEREAEWIALKQWWRAERQLHQAVDEPQRRRARQARSRVATLYRAELRRAWPKWHQVQRQRPRS